MKKREPNNLSVHGVCEWNEVRSWEDVHLEEIARNGFSVVPSVLNNEELEYARHALDRLYDLQLTEFGEDNLAAIKDKYIIRSMLVYDEFFLNRVALNEQMLLIVKKILGENISLSSQVGILNPPEDKIYQTAWHRELQYQHFTSSRPLAVQTLICVDKFDPQTGGTFFIPGSHLHESFPSDQYVKKHEYQIVANPGDAIIFNALTYHRAGINRSVGVRRAINNLYTLPIIQQQINFSRMLKGKYRQNPFLAGFLGYRWETADSVIDWRKSHLSRKS